MPIYTNIELAHRIVNRARSARRQGFRPDNTELEILRARILIEQHEIALNRPLSASVRYCTPSLDERRETVAYLQAEIDAIEKVAS